MRSLEKLGLEDLTRLELGQFLEDGFRAAYFKWFRCLRQTWKGGADRQEYTQNSSLRCHDLGCALRYPIHGEMKRLKIGCGWCNVERCCSRIHIWRSHKPAGLPLLE